jgi:hypothetical protein
MAIFTQSVQFQQMAVDEKVKLFGQLLRQRVSGDVAFTCLRRCLPGLLPRCTALEPVLRRSRSIHQPPFVPANHLWLFGKDGVQIVLVHFGNQAG